MHFSSNVPPNSTSLPQSLPRHISTEINVVCCLGRVEIYYPCWQYTDLFIFRFISQPSGRTTGNEIAKWVNWRRAVNNLVPMQSQHFLAAGLWVRDWLLLLKICQLFLKICRLMYGKPPHMPHVKNVPPEVSWRQTNKLNKQTNKQIDKQTNKQTNKQINKQYWTDKKMNTTK